jgi:hypothetical protein
MKDVWLDVYRLGGGLLAERKQMRFELRDRFKLVRRALEQQVSLTKVSRGRGR